MGLYDLGKEQRLQLVDQINGEVLVDLQKGKSGNIVIYCSDDDTYIHTYIHTYIRKTVYLAVGKIYKDFSMNIILLEMRLLGRLKKWERKIPNPF